LGASNRTSGKRAGQRRGGGPFAAVLGAAALLAFIAGSFIFANLFLFPPASAEPSDPERSGLGRFIGMPIRPNLPGSGGEDRKAEAAGKNRVNFLLLGIDQRDDERGAPTRSDSIMVVSVDTANKRAAMISFPRDMWVEIPGFADNRINVANFLGDATNYPGGGPALAKKTIEHNFGLRIDYYARIDFRGFERIVDTLGGIEVDVERAIRDDEYPTEDYGIMSIYIPAGRQHMDGKVALQYARSRHSENDFGRAQRQQKLLLAIRDRAMNLDVIPKLPSLMGTLFDMVQTDIPATEFLRFATLARDIGNNNIANLVIDTKLVTPFTGQGGADLLMPDRPAIKRAIASLLVDPAIREEAAAIEVANGTHQAGLATKTGEYLMERGFDVVAVSNADSSDYQKTRIVASPEKKQTATLLAEALRLDRQAVTWQTSGSSGREPDIRVILGEDLAIFR
jgi:polyisoprenyl-teichoic acid--peptidoglycan teichoic acid transferase